MGIVAGEDEARARATLVEMQSRISLGPHAALGVDEGASPGDVRAAFLGLTKTFHPARFGRMSPEVQRLSNEVFLGIKGAHETLMKLLGVPLRAPATGSGSIARSGSPPLAERTTQRMPQLPPQTTPAFGVKIGARPGTPPQPSGTGSVPTQPAPQLDERVELQRALDLMTARNWNAARQAMTSLAARVPTSKQYRALLCYTRGREAQAAGKGEEAVMELQRALQFDPDLGQAKTALAEVLRR
jgi:hypothetical protein